MFLAPDMYYINKPGILVRSDGQRFIYGKKKSKSKLKKTKQIKNKLKSRKIK